MNDSAGGFPGPDRLLMQATVVLLVFQTVFLAAQELDDARFSSAMVGVLAATLAFSAVNRRLFANPQGRHAGRYVAAWRYTVLAFLGVLSVVIALRAYAPDAAKGTPIVIAMLLSAMIGLKGALLGKLKPGGVLGLRLPWTCRSRLAWERAHRLMGRVLFFGGVLGLLTAPFVPFAVTVLGIATVVSIGVAAGAIESWLVWRTDPERRGG